MLDGFVVRPARLPVLACDGEGVDVLRLRVTSPRKGKLGLLAYGRVYGAQTRFPGWGGPELEQRRWQPLDVRCGSVRQSVWVLPRESDLVLSVAKPFLPLTAPAYRLAVGDEIAVFPDGRTVAIAWKAMAPSWADEQLTGVAGAL